MLVKIRDGTDEGSLEAVCAKIRETGDLTPHIDRGVSHTIIRVIGEVNGRFQTLESQLGAMTGVEDVQRIGTKYKLSAKLHSDDKQVIDVGRGVKVGTEQELIVVAGPCSIESEEQLRTIARGVKESGATILRGGAFKPRTAPGMFEGLKEDGLKMLRDIGGELNMPTQTEVMSQFDVDLVARYADILQIGARNMQNYALLNDVGKIGKPVVLKRNPGASYEEWLMAADRLMHEGSSNVILCERGIKGIDQSFTRNTTDGASIPVVRSKSKLPTMWDSSHSVGKRDLIPNVALSGITLGADVQHLEVHNDPPNALTDGAQSLDLREFDLLMQKMRIVHAARRQCEALELDLATS